MVQTIINYELGITNCHATNQNQGHQGNQENHGSDKIMLQTWFSDILVANEDEGCNQLGIGN